MYRPRPLTRMMRNASEDATEEQINDPNSVYIGNDETVASKVGRSTSKRDLELLRRVCNRNLVTDTAMAGMGVVITARKMPLGDVEIGDGIFSNVLENAIEHGPGIAVTSLVVAAGLEFLEVRQSIDMRLMELSFDRD